MAAPPSSLLSHAAVAVSAFALGGFCCQRRQQAPQKIDLFSERELPKARAPPTPTKTPPTPPAWPHGESTPPVRRGHRNKNSRKLFKGEESAIKVYCAGTLGEFQGTIPRLVRQSEHVLEIGVSGGGTSALLRLACPHVLTIDVERKDWAAAISEAGGSVTLLDAVTDIEGLRGLPIDPTILYVDLSTILGHDPSFDGIALLRQLGRVFRGSVSTIVVRSRALRAHAAQFVDPHALPEYTADQPPLETLRFAPTLRSASKVFCCVGVTEYRKTISWLVHGDDCVLEIGCQGGLTTDLIARHVRRIRTMTDDGRSSSGSSDGSGDSDRVVGVVGVDVAKKSVTHAQKNFPGTVSFFETCDGWDSARIVELGQQESRRLREALGPGVPEQRNWSVVYVDVSGLSGRAALLDALALVQQLRRSLKPSLRAVVIKSRCLRDFAVGFADARELLEDRHEDPQVSTELEPEAPSQPRRQIQTVEQGASGAQSRLGAAEHEEEICEFEVLEDGEGEDALPSVARTGSHGLGFAGAATAVVADKKLQSSVGWLSWALGNGDSDY